MMLSMKRYTVSVEKVARTLHTFIFSCVILLISQSGLCAS